VAASLFMQKNNMTVQINTDKNIEGNEKFIAYFTSLIEQELGKYDNITRIEVHLSDENGSKEGRADKRCMLEARLEGKQPIAVTNTASTIEKAVDEAINKMKTSLETILGKMNNR
jgi:ribosome-associated translation inhibitor RaiA